MQHLDDTRARAERELAEWLARKPQREHWRALLVNDMLARLRVVLWGTSNKDEWELGRAEVDQKLREAATVFWSGSVLQRPEESSSVEGRATAVQQHRRFP